MRKQTFLSLLAATVLLVSGTSLIAGEENADYTKYGLQSEAGTGTASFGWAAGYNDLTYGAKYNTMIGHEAGAVNRGDHNAYVGYKSGYGSVGWGVENVALGSRSSYLGGGSFNVMLGYASGYDSYASSVVYMGYKAGYSNTRDNTLYIENSDSNSPLIYGEFDTKMLRVNGIMEINATVLQKEDADIYPFLRIRGENTLPQEMNWMMGIAKPTDDSAQRFYVRNMVTAQSPFNISGKALNQTLVVGSAEEGMESNVGIGTGTPTAKLDVNGTIAGKFIGSDTTNNHNLLGLSVNNTGDGASDVGFSLENIESDFKWTFRTYNPVEGFAASKIGTGGTEFEVGNTGTDLSTTVVKMGGVVVFKDGHLVNTSGDELASLVQEQNIKLAAMEAESKSKDAVIIAMKAEAKAKGQKIAAMESDAKTMKVKQEAQNKKISQLETMQQKVVMMESILTNLALDTSTDKKDKVSLNK